MLRITFAQLPDELAKAVNQYTGGKPIRPGRVQFEIASIVENGNSVPVTVTVESPMTATDYVKSIQDGEALWNRAVGAAGKSCAGCHGDAKTSMKGVAARYPSFDTVSKRPVTLSQRTDLCRTRNQKAETLQAESEALLGIEAYVATQLELYLNQRAAGMPMETPAVRP